MHSEFKLLFSVYTVIVLLFGQMAFASTDSDDLSYLNLLAAKNANFTIYVNVSCGICSTEVSRNIKNELEEKIKRWLLLYEIPYLNNEELEKNTFLMLLAAGVPYADMKASLEEMLDTTIITNEKNRFFTLIYSFQTTDSATHFAYISELRLVGTMSVVNPANDENERVLQATIWGDLFYGCNSNGVEGAKMVAIDNARDLIEEFAYQYKKMKKYKQNNK
ncbi:hypothetical protein [Oceanithermus sp.]